MVRIVSDLVRFFCRRIIFAPAVFKIIVYFLIIIVGSLLNYYGLAPTSYLSSKTNVFNVYFAKLGWAWTTGLLLPFIFLTLMPTHTPRQIVMHHLVRLLIATGIWYVITKFFVGLESYTGMCLQIESPVLSKRVCLKGGHKWQEGYDLSGHTFLLMYALLIINEEVKSYDKGQKKANTIQKSASAKTTARAAGEPATQTDAEKLNLVSKATLVLYVLLAILTVIWEFMLLSTALYFHHATHKIGAGVVAVALWWATYRLWYRHDSSSILHPSSPKD